MAPPELIDGHKEFEVEDILDSQCRYCKLQSLVKWKGYTDDDDRTWEPVENLTHCKELLKEFHDKHPQAIRSIEGIYPVKKYA